MSPRAQLVAALRAALPTAWDVRDYDSDDLGNLTKVTVTVQTTALAAARTTRVWDGTVVVDVVAPQEKYVTAEETLEGALLELLGALRADPATKNRIDGAQRIVRAERHHAWRFTLTVPLKEE